MIELTYEPIDPQSVIRRAESPLAGAVVLFLGTTRELTGERRTESLRYECYADMARRKLDQLVHEARQRWPLEGCYVVHRLGRVDIGEISVAIAVSSAHRQPAFEAGQWLIDSIKTSVPIWKCEQWADGTSDWVHPGSAEPQLDDAATRVEP